MTTQIIQKPEIQLPLLAVGSSPDELLTLEDASKQTKLSKRKLQLDMASGALAYLKFGRAVRFLQSDLHDYILARRVTHRRDR